MSDTIITLDCCHSGRFGQAPPIDENVSAIGEGVCALTATRPSEQSLEVGGGGVFSSLVVEALEGGAAGILGEVTVASAYAYIDDALGAWDQRPLFKANVSRFVHLRHARPKAGVALLRRIIDHFPVPAEDRALDPSYEPTAEPRDPVNESVFADLQKLYSVGLVEPVEADYMYYAAMNSEACRLTILGRYYWRLVHEGRI